MGVQFNLLPDVKLEFDRQKRAKRLLFTFSFLIGGVVLGILILTFVFVNIVQKSSLNGANDEITKYSKKIKGIPDLEKVLTIQNQLNSLPKLHQAKHVSSRIFSYLPHITPTKVFIGDVDLDFTTNTIKITGTTDTLETVNAFVDTMKFTNYKMGLGSEAKGDAITAFTNVVLSSSGRTDKGANFTIEATFDPALFDNTQNVTLVVPDKITTRSVIESPDINSLLFNGQTGKPADQQGGQ